MARAREFGLLHRGLLSRARIWKHMEDVYGPEFLGAVGLPTSYSPGMVRRYAAPFKRGGARLDAGVVILIAVALRLDPEELCQPVSEDEPRAPGGVDGEASVSPQLVKDDELKRALEEAGYVLNRAATALGINRSRLICRIIDAGIQCPIVQGCNAKYSEAEIREMMEMLRKGLPRAQIQQLFACASSFLDQIPIYDPTLRANAKVSRHHQSKVDHREAIEGYLKRHPGSARSQLRNALPGPISFLDRHDKTWLRAVLDGLPKQPSRTQHPDAGRGRMDDDEFDRAVVGRLSAARDEMLEVVPPRRITVSLAFRVAAVPKGAYRRLFSGRLPRTEALLKEITEAENSYAERKLRYAVQQLAESRSTITATSLRLASGFRPAKLAQHREAIQRMAEEAGMTLQSRSKWVFA